MTVAKACTNCGDTLSSKSNLNRHIQQKHPYCLHKKKTNKIHKVQKRESNDDIDIQILNKQLLILLLRDKLLTIIHKEQCE